MSYTVEAVLPGAAPATGANNAEAAASSSSLGTVPASTAGSAVERVQRVEADLLRRRDELRAFEADYRQVQLLSEGLLSSCGDQMPWRAFKLGHFCRIF